MPNIVFDRDGAATAVWYQFDGVRDNVWSNRYTVGAGWGNAELIEIDDAGGGRAPQVAVDDSGNVHAVWLQFDGTRNRVWTNLYTISGGWGVAEIIDNDGGNIDSPQVVVSPNGVAIAIWSQSDGVVSSIWSSRYVVSTGWGGVAELIETDDTVSAALQQISIDEAGNAFAVWRQDDILSNRYIVGDGWNVAKAITKENGSSASFPQITTDGNGSTIVVWTQTDGSQNNIWANRYTPTDGWSVAALIESNDIGNAIAPQVASDKSGNTIAIWTQSDGSQASIWFNRYTVDSGWAFSEVIESEENSTVPEVAIALDGSAMAVWQQFDGANFNIWASRFE